MKFWYFRFEGKFTIDSPDFGDGVFSSCLVPENHYQKAKSIFFQALKEKQIDIIEVIEYFSVNGEDLDPEDKQNLFWIKWYKKVKKKNKIDFDTLHLYKLNN